MSWPFLPLIGTTHLAIFLCCICMWLKTPALSELATLVIVLCLKKALVNLTCSLVCVLSDRPICLLQQWPTLSFQLLLHIEACCFFSNDELLLLSPASINNWEIIWEQQTLQFLSQSPMPQALESVTSAPKQNR